MNINKFIEDNLDDILDNPEYFINDKIELDKETNEVNVYDIIDKTNEGSILKAVGERALKDEDLHKARKDSVGDYDCFFGFITNPIK